LGRYPRFGPPGLCFFPCAQPNSRSPHTGADKGGPPASHHTTTCGTVAATHWRVGRYHCSSSFPLPAYGAGGAPARARSLDQLTASLVESTYRSSWGDKGHRTLTFPLYPPRRLATREGRRRRVEPPRGNSEVDGTQAFGIAPNVLCKIEEGRW
jgi:hypothetical protein